MITSLAKLVLIGTAACVIHGQSLRPGSLLTGFVYDAEARSLRAIVGLPGSAYTGAAVAGDLDMAWPGGRVAAIGLRGGQSVLLTGLDTFSPDERRDDRLIVPDRVVWSPAANVALLYSSEHGLLQRVTVSPEIAIEPPVSVGFLGENISLLAVSDARRVAFAMSGRVYAMRESAPREIAADIPGLSALAFGNNDVIYAASESAVLEMRTDGSGVTTKQLVEGKRLTALAVNRKNGWIYGVDADARQLLVYDPATGRLKTLELERTPSTLQVLKPDCLLLLNGMDGPGLPLMVLDIVNDPVLWFIPAAGGDRI